MTEQGRIHLDGSDLEVRKHGPLSGRWTLEQGDTVLAEAYKPSAMIRCFEVTARDAQFTLRAKSPFTRAFEISNESGIIGDISPAHPLTRRATIDCTPAIQEHLQLFAFWLVGLAWKRAAKNSGAG